LQAKTAAFKMRFRSFLKAQLENLGEDDEAAATVFVDEQKAPGEAEEKQEERELDPAE
jgi:formiminotetrahydrofolate cyclodeaminase